MGSAAMDQAGDLALGYSASSSTLNPAIRYTGRVPTDPSGTLESELSIIEGTGSQTNGLHRWGDYSSLRIDPSDDCTFWYINEYLQSSGAFNWSTRIGSFKFSGCGTALPDFSVSTNPTSATVNAGQSPTSSISVAALNGFSASVDLSIASGCPANATCSVSPSSVTPGTPATLTVATTSTTPAATYQVSVNGKSGNLNHNAMFAVTVNATATDFSISAPPSINVSRKSSNSVTVTLTAIGNSSSVTLSIAGLPSKVTATFSNNPATASGTSTLTISANPASSRGTYTLIITGTSGTVTHTAPISLTVN